MEGVVWLRGGFLGACLPVSLGMGATAGSWGLHRGHCHFPVGFRGCLVPGAAGGCRQRPEGLGKRLEGKVMLSSEAKLPH